MRQEERGTIRDWLETDDPFGKAQGTDCNSRRPIVLPIPIEGTLRIIPKSAPFCTVLPLKNRLEQPAKVTARPTKRDAFGNVGVLLLRTAVLWVGITGKRARASSGNEGWHSAPASPANQFTAIERVRSNQRGL